MSHADQQSDNKSPLTTLIHDLWKQRIFVYILNLRKRLHIEDQTISLTIKYVQMYLNRLRDVPHQLTRHPSGVLGSELENVIKWGKIIRLGSVFVAAKINECRTTNPILVKNFKTTNGISKTDYLL